MSYERIHWDENMKLNPENLNNMDRGIEQTHGQSVTEDERDDLAGEDLFTGRIVFNTTNERLEVYDGSEWRAVTPEDLFDDHLVDTSNPHAVSAAQVGAASDPHDLGGDEHESDTLANLNTKIADATLDDSGDARDPKTHGNAAHDPDFAATDGDYTDLRARATTKDDVGLGNVENKTAEDIRTQSTQLKREVASSFPSSPKDGQTILLTQEDGGKDPGPYTYFDGEWL